MALWGMLPLECSPFRVLTMGTKPGGEPSFARHLPDRTVSGGARGRRAPRRSLRSPSAPAGPRCRSLDHFIRPRKQRRQNRETECPRSLQVDHQFEFGRLLYWYVSRFGPLQDLVDEDSATSPEVKKIRGIGHETPSLDKEAILIHGAEPVLNGELSSLIHHMGTHEKF